MEKITRPAKTVRKVNNMKDKDVISRTEDTIEVNSTNFNQMRFSITEEDIATWVDLLRSSGISCKDCRCPLFNHSIGHCIMGLSPTTEYDQKCYKRLIAWLKQEITLKLKLGEVAKKAPETADEK